MAESDLSVPTSLYRYYDSDGILLYVGITSRRSARNQERYSSKEWWPFVARQDVKHFHTRGEAEEAERTVIKAHRPPFNVQHNSGHSQLRDAYMAQKDAEEADLEDRSQQAFSIAWDGGYNYGVERYASLDLYARCLHSVVDGYLMEQHDSHPARWWAEFHPRGRPEWKTGA